MAGELVSRTAEAFYNGVWNDITADAENEDTVTIRRGVDNEGGSAAAGTLGLTLNNGTSNVAPLVSSRYARGNALSDLFGLLPPNTPIRVSAGLAGGVQTVRMAGEIVQLPPRADVSQRDLWVPVEAAGVLRRLGIPESPLADTVRRFVADQLGAVGYWPLSDLEGSRRAAALIGSDLRFTSFDLSGFARSAPNFGSGFLGAHLPAGMETSSGAGGWTGGQMQGATAAGTGSGGFALDVMFRAIQGQESTDVPMFAGFSVTASRRWRWLPSETTRTDLRVQQFNEEGSAVANATDFDAGPLFDGLTHLVRLQVSEAAGDTADWELFVDGASSGSGTFDIGTSSVGVPGVAHVDWFASSASNAVAPFHVGQFIVWNGTIPSLDTTLQATRGYAGETAGRRVERLCDELGVLFASTGDLDAAAPMGAQYPGEFLTILGEAAKVEAGGSRAPILVEQRGAAGLHFNALNALYLPRAADLTLDYTAAQLSPPFDPTPDDLGLVNDATARRRDGGEVRVEVDGGPKGIDAAGRYDKADTFDAQADSQLGDIAGWWSGHGTWDEDRYPTIRIDMRSLSTRTDGAALVAAVQALDPGALVEIVNPPAWLPQQTIQQMVLGITETISTEEWLIDLHTTPAGPFTTFVLGDPVYGRVDTDGSELSQPAGAADTTLTVSTTAWGGVRWAETGELVASFPFNVLLGGGEVARVTGIAATTVDKIQTFTVVRGVNGIQREWLVGTPVQLSRSAVGL